MPQLGLRSRRAGLAGAIVLAFTLVLCLAAGSAASGAPSAQAPATVVHTYPVTLVTGDRVVLNALSDGKRTITLATSPGARTTTTLSPSFHAVEENGDLYVWPVDIGVYVGTLLDQELFNVSKLVRQGYADGASSTIPVIVDYGSKPGAGDIQALDQRG